MLLCVDFCGGYCSFLVNYSVGLEKAGLRVNRELSQTAQEKVEHKSAIFEKGHRPILKKNYIFGIGTSSGIEWYLSFLLSMSWPSDEPWAERATRQPVNLGWAGELLARRADRPTL